MFSKLKSRKPPLSLSSVSNVIKTAGAQTLSPEEINPKHLSVSTVSQLGIPKNSIVAVAYDPVQSLLAISTNTNEIRIYGQNTVEVVFEFRSTSPITLLKFVKGVYLVGVSPTSGGVTVLSLHTKKILGTFSPSGTVNSIEADPSLDWLILGLTNGSLLFYDVDRLSLTPFRIDNLQKKVLPKQKLSPALSIEWHPRDIGTILVTYSHSAILYSLIKGEIKNVFVYQLDKNARGFEYSSHIANGGKKKLFGSSKEVIPQLIESHFHPNGLHILTVHNDNTLVFWDANSATLLEARTIFEINLHKPGVPLDPPGDFAQISNVRWICGNDPEATLLVISGGDPKQRNLLHVLDFGFTLKYSLTSHEKQGEFYAQPQLGQRTIPVSFNDISDEEGESEYVTQILPLAADSLPYFNGNHDPSHLVLLSNYKSLYIVPFSSYGSIQDGNLGGLLLPPSISLIHPPVVCSYVQPVPRIQWYSILSNRASTGASARNVSLLKGGASAGNVHIPRSVGYDDSYRNILITGHKEGLIRFLDISRGDHQEAESLIQFSLKETLFDNGDPQSVMVTSVSCGFETREMIAGLGNGDVVIFKFGKRSSRSDQGSSSHIDYSNCLVQHSNGNAKIIKLDDRISGSFASSSTFLPVSLFQLHAPDTISCLKMSNIGFAAVGYKSGRLVVCDISRGPAVILNVDSIKEFIPSLSCDCYVTTIEFAIMEYGQDGYSSIIMMAGTNGGGNLILFKIIPQANGGFEVVFTDKTIGLNYRSLKNDEQDSSQIDQIIPISAKDGKSTVASLDMFQKLSHGIIIPGLTILTSQRDIRVIKLPKTKLSHVVIEDSCLKCGIVRFHDKGIVLATLVKSGYIRFSALPSLSNITDIKLPKEIYEKIKESLASTIASQSDILLTGDVCIRTSDTECMNVSIYSKDSNRATKGEPTTDLLFNENTLIPPRPSAGALQWAKGQTKYINSQDLAFLIAGPNRKPAKHPESRLAHNISPEANPSQGYGGYLTNVMASPSDNNGRGYKVPVRRATNTSQSSDLGANGFMRSIQNGIESVEESFNGYAHNLSESMGETVDSQKKSFYGAAFKSKFGF